MRQGFTLLDGGTSKRHSRRIKHKIEQGGIYFMKLCLLSFYNMKRRLFGYFTISADSLRSLTNFQISCMNRKHMTCNIKRQLTLTNSDHEKPWRSAWYMRHRSMTNCWSCLRLNKFSDEFANCNNCWHERREHSFFFLIESMTRFDRMRRCANIVKLI